MESVHKIALASTIKSNEFSSFKYLINSFYNEVDKVTSATLTRIDEVSQLIEKAWNVKVKGDSILASKLQDPPEMAFVEQSLRIVSHIGEALHDFRPYAYQLENILLAKQTIEKYTGYLHMNKNDPDAPAKIQQQMGYEAPIHLHNIYCDG